MTSPYINIHASPAANFAIDEVKTKPTGIRAIETLKILYDYTTAYPDPQTRTISFKGKTLEGRGANVVIRDILQRVVNGYDNPYSFRGLLRRIQHVVYFVFGWETERAEIHKLQVKINKTLQEASSQVDDKQPSRPSFFASIFPISTLLAAFKPLKYLFVLGRIDDQTTVKTLAQQIGKRKCDFISVKSMDTRYAAEFEAAHQAGQVIPIRVLFVGSRFDDYARFDIKQAYEFFGKKCVTLLLWDHTAIQSDMNSIMTGLRDTHPGLVCVSARRTGMTFSTTVSNPKETFQQIRAASACFLESV